MYDTIQWFAVTASYERHWAWQATVGRCPVQLPASCHELVVMVQPFGGVVVCKCGQQHTVVGIRQGLVASIHHAPLLLLRKNGALTPHHPIIRLFTHSLTLLKGCMMFIHCMHPFLDSCARCNVLAGASLDRTSQCPSSIAYITSWVLVQDAMFQQEPLLT